MRIQHNIAALNSYRNLTNNNSAVAKNLEKLSSGYRINRAGDDAAGLAISEKMRAQITGLNTAQKNANDGISLVQTAEGALTEVHSMLNRMVELANQSANGTYDDAVDRANLQKEIESLLSEIDRISEGTNYNGINLLDGSMDSTVRTTQNASSEAFKIADWVGNAANQDAVVGTGTIVHTGTKEAAKTVFSVEFNNSTAIGENGVSITLGENEAMTLDKTQIAAGASAEDIAAAFADAYKDGVTLKSDAGEDVKFNVTADGDRLVFEQAEDPANANQVVTGAMTIKYEGIGSGAAAAPALNTTEIKAAEIDPAKNNAHVAQPTFGWANGVTDEAKDKLNKALENGADIKVTVKADGAAAANVADDSRKVDISALTAALGEGYTVTAKEGTAVNPTTVVKADDKGVVTLTGTNDHLDLLIKDADGNNVGTLSLVLPVKTGGLALNAGTTGTPANATTGAELKTTLSIGAGNNKAMNTEPAVTIDDKGGLQSKDATPPALFALESTLTADQKDALNAAIADGDQTITIQMSDLNGNAVKNGSKATLELSQGLKDAGYYIGTNTANPPAKYNEETGYTADMTGANQAFYLYDKDNNKIATITLGTKDNNGSAGKEITSDATTITLSASKFNKETTKNDGLKEEGVQIKLVAADVSGDDSKTQTDISSIDWGGTTANSLKWNAGDKLTMTIDGKDYEVTMKNGGLNADEAASGKYIDISTAADVDTGAEVRALLQTAIGKQMNANAATAAKGTEDYTKYDTSGTAGDTLTFTVNADDPAKIDVKADTTRYTYVGETANDTPGTDDPGAAGAAGGKDPNASTVNITQGNAKGEGRLASTYITADMLAGLKDGSQLKVGDTMYTFAVGKDSQVTGANVIDLKDLEADDANLTKEALTRLTPVANANPMFSTGTDNGRLTFTENKDYTWAEGVDLSTREGIAEQFGFYIDGASTTAASGKNLTLQIGDTSEEFNRLSLSIGSTSAEALGLAGLNIGTQEGAAAAVDKIKAAINSVSATRGDLGAVQNRLEHTINNLSVAAENITAAESRIRDVDMAQEMMAYTKNNILVQAAQAMLAQANQVPQGVLQLLQ